MKAFFKSLYRAVLDSLFPPVCLKCGAAVAEDQSLCADCWKQIRFIAPPLCARCGMPFDVPVEAGTLCGACLAGASALGLVRSAFVYDEASRGIVLRFKHADAVHTARALAGLLARAGGDVLSGADVVTPVPLHRWRLLRRRYNQAAILARFLAAEKDIAFAPDLLVRARATESQGHKTKRERAINVRGAFSVHPAYDVAGLCVVLIDDVMTSGATLEECARVLLQAGAREVRALTLARVVFAS